MIGTHFHMFGTCFVHLFKPNGLLSVNLRINYFVFLKQAICKFNAKKLKDTRMHTLNSPIQEGLGFDDVASDCKQKHYRS